MSTLRVNNLQIGQSGTAAQNFTLYQPTTPDGTLRLAVGNSGATTGDVLSVSNTGLSVTGTLSATGNVTLSGGTANGVLYLNGSKVATTGSALTFDGTNLGVGAAATANYGNLQVTGSAQSSLFSQLGTDTIRMGVRATGRTGIVLDSSNATYTNRMWYIDNQGSAGSLVVGRPGLDVLTFDNSGNLGLGVTPSAWGSNSKAIQINRTPASAVPTIAVGDQGNESFISRNAYHNGTSWTYVISDIASRYELNSNGGFRWYNAASGTANTAITFTQAMTLDAGGNLGVSTTTTAVNGGDYRNIVLGGVTTNAGGYYITQNSDGSVRGQLGIDTSVIYIGSRTNHPVAFTCNNAERARITSGGYLGISTSSPQNYLDLGASSTGNGLTWSNYSNVFSEYSSGALILSSNYYGNIGSGGYKTATTATFGAAGIQVSGTSGSGTSGLIQFFVDPATSKTAGNAFTPTERVRITSGGDLLVGTTNSSSTAGTGLKITAGSSQADSLSIVTGATTNGGLTTYQLYTTGASAYRFYVGAGGTIYATSTTITAISDQRLKENIQDLDVGLDKIMALKPRKFDWKESKGKDKKGDRGWIAQEFEQVFPDMIDTWRDPAPEGEEPYKAVNADLMPVLVKAIQEQQALITALTARVAALEGT